MIDIHSHILPGVDDGAGTLEESVEMAWAYEWAGFDTVIATPHHIPGTSWHVTPETVRNSVAHLNRVLAREGIRMRVAPGMEIGLASEVPRLLKENALLPLAGSRYLLLETPFQRLPLNWEQTVFELAAAGFRVVWAHPERCTQLQETPEQVKRMLDIGSFLQVNWGSLLGYNGSETGVFAREMIRKGRVHCLATDSHDTAYRCPETADKGIKALEAAAGPENAARMAKENPVRILKSEKLIAVDPLPAAETKNPSGIRRLFPWKR